jgi:hypothetical protein
MSKPPPEPIEGIGFAYTSTPRLLNPERTLTQLASDVAFINANFAESDIEVIDPEGRVTVIYDCTKSDVICAAQEGRLNPAGKLLAFSVSFGDSMSGPNIRAVREAYIYIHELETGKTWVMPNQKKGSINRMPDWINNETVTYSSNAADKYGFKDQCSMHRGKRKDGKTRWCNGQYGFSQNYGTGPESKAMQIWRSNIDGTDRRNLTPHEAMAIKPTVLKHPRHKGRILYSCLQSGEDKAFYQPNHSGNPATVQNLTWLCSIDQNGADHTVVVGGHGSKLIPNSSFLEPGWTGGQQHDKILAIRVAGEDADGNITFTSYYRKNHYGLGNLYTVLVLIHSVEGCSTNRCYSLMPEDDMRYGSGQYMPLSLMPLNPYAVGQDVAQRFDKKGRVMGKDGFPSILPNGNWLVTHCFGWCMLQITEAQKKQVLAGGQPLRDEGLYEIPRGTIVIDPFDPNQLIKLVDSPDKLERDGVALVPTAMPPQTPPLTGDKCYLQIVDVRAAELRPANPYTRFRDLGFHTALQGNAVKADDPDFHRENLHSFAIQYADLWNVMYPDPKFAATSNYMGIMRTYPPIYALPEEDGSLKMEVECERPLKMSGLDENGAQIAHDPMLQSLRTGETRTCHGCHDGHSAERYVFELKGESPQDRFAKTLAAKKPPAETTQEPNASWSAVKKILERKCSTCHEGFTDDGLLWSRLTADYEQLDWDWVKKVPVPNKDGKILRPCFSPFVCRYARWSPLYWVAIGERTDGYTNDTFPDDFDYPVGHPKVLWKWEQRKVATWIGMGAPN